MGRPDRKGRDFWGPAVWKSLHIFAASYKPSAAASFKKFVEALPDLLPCPSCGVHLRKNLAEHPPDRYMRNNHELFFWTYVIHDRVNARCNAESEAESNEATTGRELVVKKKQSPSFDDVKRYYFSGLGEECKVCQL